MWHPRVLGDRWDSQFSWAPAKPLSPAALLYWISSREMRMDVRGSEDHVSGCGSNPWPDVSEARPSVPHLGSLEAAWKRLIQVNTEEQCGEGCPLKLKGKNSKQQTKMQDICFWGEKERKKGGEKRGRENSPKQSSREMGAGRRLEGRGPHGRPANRCTRRRPPSCKVTEWRIRAGVHRFHLRGD